MGNSLQVGPQVGEQENHRVRRSRGPGFLLTVLTLIYACLLLFISIINALGPDRWWLGSVNLYLPQWLWALPCVLLLPWYLARSWRWTWAPLLLAAWVFFPLMGWSFGIVRIRRPSHGTSLRVMQYNVKWASRDPAAVLANIDDANPDLLVMQDSGKVLDRPLAALKKPNLYRTRLSQFTVVSRFPIVSATLRPLSADPHSLTLVVNILFGGRPVAIYDVHLMTPRWALHSLADNGSDGAGDIQHNSDVRMQEACSLADLIKGQPPSPCLVVGDLNAPEQSRMFGVLSRIGLRDAFSEAGWGYGYTYGQSTKIRGPYVRIDHILVSPEWSVVNCRVGNSKGSDHSPVIADIVLSDLSPGARK